MNNEASGGDGCTTVINIVLRLMLLAFLIVAGSISALMVGLSGDSGTNFLFIYLCLSWLLFVSSGLALLATPSEAIISSTRSAKVVTRTFLISIAQPFVGLFLFYFITDQM